MTNNSILKSSGAFHCVKTSSIRFWAFSYSMGDPCGRSNQLIMYFIVFPIFPCAQAKWPGSGREDGRNAPPAHGEDSLCRGNSLLYQPALEGIEGRAGAGADADLGIEALDVVVGGLGRDLELPGRFFRRMSGCDQSQN